MSLVEMNPESNKTRCLPFLHLSLLRCAASARSQPPATVHGERHDNTDQRQITSSLITFGRKRDSGLRKIAFGAH